MATEYNLTLDQGTDLKLLLTVTDTSNNAISLDGFSFRGQAKTSFTAKTIAFNWTFDILNQENNTGKVYAIIRAQETAGLQLKDRTSYLYDVEMTDTNGDQTRLFEGKIIVRPEVTK
jgi:hypothetical protein